MHLAGRNDETIKRLRQIVIHRFILSDGEWVIPFDSDLEEIYPSLSLLSSPTAELQE